jgi:hypothetical protein
MFLKVFLLALTWTLPRLIWSTYGSLATVALVHAFEKVKPCPYKKACSTIARAARSNEPFTTRAKSDEPFTTRERGKATAWTLSLRSARWQSCERSTRRGHAGRVKSDRAVHRCRRSTCRSRLCVGLCIFVVALLAAAADAVLVALKVHPATIAGNPKAWGKTTARLPRARSA